MTLEQAIATNDVTHIETTLNLIGISAMVRNRNTDAECLEIEGFGSVVFDGRMEECPGYFIRYADYDDIVEPDELLRALQKFVQKEMKEGFEAFAARLG